MSGQPPPPPRPTPPLQQPPLETSSKPAVSRRRPYKPKVKTGCTSCRIRRVKCDEGKPSCQRCITTGRTCDGYEDLFRIVQWTPNDDAEEEPETEPVPRKTQRKRRAGEQLPFVVVYPTGPTAPTGSIPTSSSTSRRPAPFEAVATPPSTASSPSSSSSWPSAATWTSTMQRDMYSPAVKSPSTPQSGVAALYHHHPSASVPHNAASPGGGPQTPYRGTVPHRLVAAGIRQFQPHPHPHPRPMSPSLAPSTPLTAQDIAALAARFTNKPTSQGYEHEARTTLEASQSEPAVRHALASLRSLYMTLEDHGHEFPHGRLAVPTVYHGLQEYHNAIVNLTNKLSVVDRRSCEVALVCCRLFISIETMQRDYVSVAEHYIRGMRIMHESATRPYLDARGNVIPTQNGDFPKIDSFMLKIFMSPDRMAPACRRVISAWSRGERTERKERRRRGKSWKRGRAERSMRVVRLARTEVRAARVKARLLVLSELALMHFENVSRLRPGSDSGGVVAERSVLLEMLREFKLEGRDGERDMGPYHGRFHLLYHAALKIAVTLSLWAPTEDIKALQPVFDRVGVVARSVV